jgi:hypothetical protein
MWQGRDSQYKLDQLQNAHHTQDAEDLDYTNYSRFASSRRSRLTFRHTFLLPPPPSTPRVKKYQRLWATTAKILDIVLIVGRRTFKIR